MVTNFDVVLVKQFWALSSGGKTQRKGKYDAEQTVYTAKARVTCIVGFWGKQICVYFLQGQ